MDGTFSVDPLFWLRFIADANSCGHKVITVTSRCDTPANREKLRAALPPHHVVVFAYDKPKKLAALQANYDVDVFIDDNPQSIGDGTENVATQSVFEIELRNVHAVLNSRAQTGAIVKLIQRLETVLGNNR